MARQTYPGLGDPIREFTELAPAHERLERMARTYHPATPQYHALQHAALTLRTAAELITRQPFYRGLGNSDTGRIGEGYKGG